jgi:hypothetical protein
LEGLRLLKAPGDEAIDFKPYGGYELFLKKMKTAMRSV